MSLFGLLRRKKKSKIRALVLLFLSKLVTRKALDVHLLPSNVVLDEVKKKQENGTFLRMPAECVIMEGETYNISSDLEEARVQPKVKKKQENGTFLRMPAECVIMEGETYNISSDLEEARVQPKEHVYYRDYNQNFLPTFQIILNDDVIDLELQLFKSSDKNTAIWSRWVPVDVQRLMAMRKDFIEGVNVSVIGSLLDDLLQIRVLNDSEVEAVKQGETCTSAKARNLIDMKFPFFRDYGPNFPPTFEIFLNNDTEVLTVEVFKTKRRNSLAWLRRVQLPGSLAASFGSTGCKACRKVGETPGQGLQTVRTDFIDGVNDAIIQDLLDDMLQIRVLNDSEMEAVRQGENRTRDKARCLIDMVRRKGSSARERLLSKLEKRDPTLYHKLGLHNQLAN
ncbi:UNVERIFIED_CONTAM: hypothetical protein FKN15_052394 [Acipenser sinensis]